MNIAVYGGSFDPPTLGHVMVIAHILLNDSSVDQIYVPVCYLQKGKKLTSFEHRYTMAMKAFGWLPRVKILTIERDMGGESLTIRLIKRLIELEPDAKFRLVMGSDLLDKAPHWEGWDEILRLAPPLVIGRAGIAPRGPGDPTPVAPVVSSTIVRKALARGDYREAGRYIPVPVCRHIQNHGLYINDEST